MKESEIVPNIAVVANVKDEQVQPDLVYKGSLNLQNGLKIWEIDLSSGKMEEATFEKEDVAQFGKTTTRKKLITKKGFTYIVALNKDNAAKKLLKQFGLWQKQS